MHAVVVRLDLVEVDRLPEARRLEQVARVAPQGGQLAQLLAVALEVAVVDRVEPDQGREEPHVGLGDLLTHQVTTAGQAVLEQSSAFQSRSYAASYASCEPAKPQR